MIMISFWCQDQASPFSNQCCEQGGVSGWHSRERVVSNLLAIKAGLPGPQRGPVLLDCKQFISVQTALSLNNH